MANYNDYSELKENALKFGAKQSDVDALGEWFSEHGDDFWNGECFEIDKDHRLYPLYEEVDEDEFELKGFEIR